MKREGLIFVLVFLLINFVSASYECSDGSELTEDSKEVDLDGAKIINGLGVGVVLADEVAATGSYYANVIYDARKFAFDSENNFTEIELLSGTLDISIEDIDLDTATIKVDDDTEDIEEQNTKTVNGFAVFLSKVEGSFPDNMSVEGIVGKGLSSLDNTNANKIVTVEEVEYLLNLLSASEDNAVIFVKTCEGEGAEIVEVADAVEEETENETDLNVTETSNETDENVTEVNETEVNITTNETVTTDDSGASSDFSWRTWVIVLVIAMIVVLSGVAVALVVNDVRKANLEKNENYNFNSEEV